MFITPYPSSINSIWKAIQSLHSSIVEQCVKQRTLELVALIPCKGTHCSSPAQQHSIISFDPGEADQETMGRRRQALKEFGKGFAKGAGMGLGYGTTGAQIGLMCAARREPWSVGWQGVPSLWWF